MKFNKSLVATATTAALGMVAGNAQAFNFGEVWATDQENGRLHIFKQSELNDPTRSANPSIVDLVQAGSPANNHIIGFSNHAGLDPSSRAILTFLGGTFEVWRTNGGTGAPSKIASLEASTINAYGQEGLGAPQKGNTVHACGGNPQNDQIQCASIFNADFSLFEADMATDTYTRIGIYKTGNLTVSPKLRPRLKRKVQKAYDALVANDGDGQPNNICSQYSADGNLLYLAVQNNAIDGGVIVMDVSDPTNPTILDAFNDVMAAGCGLVNNPDGKTLWITHGFNKHGDPEEVSIWKYSRAGKRHGPIKRIKLPADDSQVLYGGDAHGAQYAGLFQSYLWQTMRVDDTIHVIKNRGRRSKIVKTINLERPGRTNIQPDVLDRSQFGTRMYHTTRGSTPNTAISTYYFSDRSGKAGIDVLGTFWGRNGRYLKTETMTSGNTEYLCPNPDAAKFYEVKCAAGDAGAIAVDTTDPHGLKSLNYLSGF
jgi:hypothetical protein